MSQNYLDFLLRDVFLDALPLKSNNYRLGKIEKKYCIYI